MEAVRSPKQTVYENRMGTPTTDVAAPSPMNPVAQSPLPETDRLQLKENMMNVLGGMMPGQNGTLSATSNDVPLQMTGNIDTSSPNGTLPTGNVSMDQIMGLMKSKG